MKGPVILCPLLDRFQKSIQIGGDGLKSFLPFSVKSHSVNIMYYLRH